MKRKLFSVSIKDCEVQTFRSGGKGGQHQNKVETGVRVIHHPSGARGESRDTRSQASNKQLAFTRMVETQEFKLWHKAMCAKLLNTESIEQRIRRMMDIRNLLIEEKLSDGSWKRIQ